MVLKQKDAYDVYFCIRNYPNGIDGLAQACRPLLDFDSGATGFRYIAEKFDTPDQGQQDAFGQVDALLHELGLRR